MKLSFAVLGLGLFATWAGAAEPSPLPPPAIEIRVKAIADLTGVIEYAGDLTFQPEAGRQFAAIVKTLAAGEKGLEGIDAALPIGAYVRISENIADSAVVAMVPVKDEAAFLALLKEKAGLDPKKGKDGLYTVDVPQVPVGAIYLRFLQGYAYATVRNSKSIDPESVLTPKEFFPKAPEAILAAVVHWHRFPTDVKKVIVGQVEMRLAEMLQGAGGTALQKQARQHLVDIGVDALQTLLLESRDLGLNLSIDPKSDAITANVKLVAKPNTRLEKNLKSWADRESPAASVAVATNPFASLGLQAKLPPTTHEKLGKIIDTLFDDALAGVDDGAKPQITKLVDALAPSLKSDDLQVGFAVVKPGGDALLQLRAAARATKGEDLETVLREFAPVLMGETSVKFDLEKYAGRNLHEASLTNEDLKRNFGTETIWLATSDDLVALTIEEKPKSLKVFLDAKPKARPMLTFELSAAQLGTISAKELSPEKYAAAIRKAFPDASPAGADTLKATIRGGEELNLKIELKGGFFKVFAALDQAKKGH